MAETTEGGGTPGAAEQPQPELCGGTTGFVMMIMMMLTVFIMFSPGLRETIAVALDGFFGPVFGFNGQFPTVTLVLTSIFLVVCSTSIRHVMTDWIGIARAQKIMSAIQKQKTDAMMKGDSVKMKKLEELNPEIAKHQMVLMTSNLKPVAFTMIFFIIVFPWIWMVFIPELAYGFVTLPGIAKWSLQDTIDWCIVPWGNWILVYFVLSLPIGFLLQNGFKYVSFSRMIKKTETEQQYNIDQAISTTENRIKAAQAKGISVSYSHELLGEAKQKLTDKKYTSASSLVKNAEEQLDRKTQSHKRTAGLIAEAEKMVKSAAEKGIGLDKASKSLENAKGSMKSNDETSAIYYAKQSQRQVKEARIEHKNAEDALSSVKATMYDLRDMDTTEADKIFEKALSAMEKKKYAEVIKYSKTTKTKAEDIMGINKKAEEALKSTKKAVDSIHHLGLDVPDANDQLNKAQDAMLKNDYEKALDLATSLIDKINSEKEKFSEAQESVSFAKLVISNASSFGADISSAEKLVKDAELALTKKQYDRVIELAGSAKDIAEAAKRQQQRLSKRK